MLSKISKASTKRFSVDTFRHPLLTQDELSQGTKLGIDSWADTCCAGKHCYVEEFVEGKMVNATGFTPSLGTVSNLPIVHALYAYNSPDGEVFLIECNNSIYLGEDMIDSLVNPIQCEENNVRVDIRPRAYYPNCPTAQSLQFENGMQLALHYDGVLPYLPVRRPTPDEVHHCQRLVLTSKDLWDPYVLNGSFSSLTSYEHNDESYVTHNLYNVDPITNDLMSLKLSTMVSQSQMLFEEDDNVDTLDATFASINKISTKRDSSITPEDLCKLLHIGLGTAQRTLKATTYQCIRSTGLLAKRFKTDRSQLRYKQLMKGFGTFYCDFLKVGCVSLRGFMGGVVYTNKVGFKKFYPCSNESGEETGRSLKSFVEFVGLPASLHSDNHKNFKEGFFRKLLRKFGIHPTYTEPHSPWQNRAEASIGEIKTYARRLMQRTSTPVRLWCFCYEYSADVLSLMATGRYELQGRTPYEVVMNYTPDISEYVSFSWYQWCWYFDEGMKAKELCRWLGPAHHIGQSFCSYIILSNGQYIARSSVIGIPESDLSSDDMKLRMEKFTKELEGHIGNYKQPRFDPIAPRSIYGDLFDDQLYDDETLLPYGDEIIDAKVEDINDAYMDSLDEYINAKVVIPGRDAVPVLATVKRRKRDSSGNPIGEANPNPILDSRVYELEFPDGRVEEYSLNVIVENLISQTDQDGFDVGLLDEIVDFRRDDEIAVPIDQGFVTSYNGQEKPIITTKGWDVLIKWKDQSLSWVPLSLAKESNPVEVAEAAVALGVSKQPAFNWWVNHTLRKRERIIKKLKAQVIRKGRMKFGIEIPGTVEEAQRLDKENGNTFWMDAVAKEMKN